LLAELRRSGLSKRAATTVCNDIADGEPPRRISTPEAYRKAWIICKAMEEVLTTLDDGSEAAVWCTALAYRIFDFEDAYKAKHGCKPLNPGGPEWTDGPTGSA
jgi:hypothetical protein